MNNLAKSIVKDSKLFDEEEGVDGLFYCNKMNYNATEGLNEMIRGIVTEITKSIELQRDCDDEIDSEDAYLDGYREGFYQACNVILDDIKVRFGV